MNNIKRILALPPDTTVINKNDGSDWKVSQIITMNTGTDPRDQAWMDCFMTLDELKAKAEASYSKEHDIFYLDPPLFDAAERHGLLT